MYKVHSVYLAGMWILCDLLLGVLHKTPCVLDYIHFGCLTRFEARAFTSSAQCQLHMLMLNL